jgi:hypothetical protein
MFAIRLDEVEMRFLFAQHWEEGKDTPDWADGDDGDITIGFGAAQESRVSVAVNMLARDDNHRSAVRTEQIARYEVALYRDGEAQPSSGNIEDFDKFVRMVGPEGLRIIANNAIQDTLPYLREAIHSTSMRLNPEHPMVLPKGVPELPPDAKLEVNTPRPS